MKKKTIPQPWDCELVLIQCQGQLNHFDLIPKHNIASFINIHVHFAFKNYTCQGISPGLASYPPTILSSDFFSAVMAGMVGEAHKGFSLGLLLTPGSSLMFTFLAGVKEELESDPNDLTFNLESDELLNRSDMFFGGMR